MAKNGPIDMSIVNRSTASSYWITANGVITPNSLANIKEQTSNNASALNSLPTPWARFFVAAEAFRRVEEAKSANSTHNTGQRAGFAYEQLVSDCLDLYELLFNIKYHRNIWNGNEDIEIVEWVANTELQKLSQTMPKLHNSINDYYSTDIGEDTLFFVIYKSGNREYLLGSSSPMTGWVTPPDLDKKQTNNDIIFSGEHYNNVRIKRKSGGYYFDGKKLFEDRDVDFKNYMFNVLFGQGTTNKKMSHITSYIRTFHHDLHIKTNYVLTLDDIFSNNGNVVSVNGIRMKKNDEVDVNSFFQTCLVKLPFKLSKADFEGISYIREKEDRDYDYLIPLTSEGIALLNLGARCVCQERNSDVVVTLEHNGNKYEKVYEENPVSITNGSIKDLAKEKKYVNLGIFPNILSPIDTENNYFKVALFEQDNNTRFKELTIDRCSALFYKKNVSGNYELIDEIAVNGNAISGVYKPVVRSRQIQGNKVGSKYYELYNSSFDALQLEIEGAKGFVIPNWRRAQRTNDSYTYAIDLGTSNTFISRTQNGANTVPVQLDMLDTMVSYLHDYKKGGQYSKAYYVENAIPEQVREVAVSEFAPPIIDGQQYDFPIRTALCTIKGNPTEPSLFDNSNIAFFYGKALQTNMHEILTDIKWEDKKKQLGVFVEQLMLIIKADLLQRNGVLNQTKIVRFRPLSFDGNIKRMYDDIWNNVPKEVFGVSPLKTECFTESEAPYYYFIKKNIVNNTDTVSVVDIGGGSTDFVYFKANNPLIASSVHFGCDELWGEGNADFGNIRGNGIYKKYFQSLIIKDKVIAGINSAMIVDNKVSAKNIINFWLDNQKYSDIQEMLRKDYAPLFVYHFTALMYYMASMYKFKGLESPRTIVFSGNGSRYIDSYISEDATIIALIIKKVFDNVYGCECPPIYVTLPQERKESTCYGGLYKDPNIPAAPVVVYHGNDKNYSTAKELINDASLMNAMLRKYKEMNSIYINILSLLKNKGIIDRAFNVRPFTDSIDVNYDNYFSTHFRSKVTEKYTSDDDVCNDAVFFIPVVQKIFDLTNVI